MTPFEFALATRFVCGPGRLAELGTLTDELGAKRVLLVSDPGIVAAGHVARALQYLQSSGIDARVFDGVAENPTTEHVERGRDVAADFRPDALIGLGGGSSLDCAKGINFLLTNGGRMQDYRGVGKAMRPMLPMIAVPTTAGTGSESQSFALITDPVAHQKMACGDKKAAFRIALLDPELTLTQPAKVTAITGIDAVAHAIETFVTTRRNPVSLMFSREAWRLLHRDLPRVFERPGDLIARGGVQLGACFAGLAIEQSMLGAAHALANPLTARHGIVHGAAVGLMLPHVIRFNAETCDAMYAELVDATSAEQSKESDGARLAAFVERQLDAGRLLRRLAEYGISRNSLAALADEAAQQWTGGFNPRPVTATELLRLYEQAY